MKKAACLAILLLISASFLFSQTVIFEDVKIRRHKSADKRQLVDKIGVLTFHDDTRQVTYESEAGDKFDVPYSDVTKVVFDSDTHMNAGAKSIALSPVSPLGGALVARIHVHDRWLYLEYSQGDHSEKVLLVLPGAICDKAIAKTQGAFGERVTITHYPEKGEAIEKNDEIDKSRVPDLKSKHAMQLDRTNHPLPETKADKATVVVVCPPLAARNTGRGNQFKLHANGRVVAVNKMGTYSIAYLDPGKYSLISQSENANGFEMDLEAGKTYYFIQETFQGFLKGQTMLSRNSPEVVMYLVDGSYYCDWKRLN
jgi:hypothetical protein